jgi:hypothetical protein
LSFTDFLKTTVLLTAGEATALGAVAVVSAGAKGDVVTLVFSLGWWVVAAIIGGWIGRKMTTTARIGTLLADARPSPALPEMRPGTILINRLWPLAVSALFAAGISWVYPQVASIATGYAILVALAWRKQDAAVAAVEGRDGVRFYVLPSSPYKGIELVRTPGYKFPSGNGTASRDRVERSFRDS